MSLRFLFLFLGLSCLPIMAQEKLEPIATISHPELVEPSGMVRSGMKPDRFWVHNDSGDIPRIFAVDLKGKTTIPYWLANKGQVDHHPSTGERIFPGIFVKRAALNDWEDITRCQDMLYIAETGNNGNVRRDMGVYQLFEPNPDGVEEVTIFQFIPIAYPEQREFPPQGPWDYDCEAVFSWKDKLYFITKNRPPGQVYLPGNSANLYRLDTMDPLKVNMLTRIDSIQEIGGWVTAADASDDGELIAMLVERPKQCIWLFNKPPSGDKFFADASRVRRFDFKDAGQVESLTFNGPDELIMLNEDRELFRIPISKFKEVPNK